MPPAGRKLGEASPGRRALAAHNTDLPAAAQTAPLSPASSSVGSSRWQNAPLSPLEDALEKAERRKAASQALQLKHLERDARGERREVNQVCVTVVDGA